jgi:hypothetical protein
LQIGDRRHRQNFRRRQFGGTGVAQSAGQPFQACVVRKIKEIGGPVSRCI